MLLEKPLAHTWDNALKIKAAAERRAGQTTFMVAEQMNFYPLIGLVRRTFGSGSECVYQFTDRGGFRPRGWRADVQLAGGGVMVDLGIHYVALATQMFGKIISTQRTILSRDARTAVPLHERLEAEHESGATGRIDVAWGAASSESLLRVSREGDSIRGRPGTRVAWHDWKPVLLGLRSADGRRPLMRAYLDAIQTGSNGESIDRALECLAVVL